MIKRECFTRQWCEHVAQRLNYNDTQLIEKVVRDSLCLKCSSSPIVLFTSKEVRQLCYCSEASPTD